MQDDGAAADWGYAVEELHCGATGCDVVEDEVEVAVAGSNYFCELCVLLTSGIAYIVFTLFRRSHPGKVYFVLSPKGILYRFLRGKQVLIPWREIQNVDTIDIVTEDWDD